MRSHEFYTERIVEFLSGENESELSVDVREHLTGCVKCSEDFEALKAVMSNFSEPAFDMPPSSYFAGLVLSVRRRIEGGGIFEWLRIEWLRLAGATALGLLVVVAALRGLDEDQKNGTGTLLTEKVPYEDFLYAENNPGDYFGGMLSSRELEELSNYVGEEFDDIIILLSSEDTGDDFIESMTEEEWELFIKRFEAERIL